MNVPPLPTMPLSSAFNAWSITGIGVVLAFLVVGIVITVKNRHEKKAKRERINSTLSTLSFVVIGVSLALNLAGIGTIVSAKTDAYVAYFKDAYGLTVAHDHAMPDDFPGLVTGTDRDGRTRTYEVRIQGDGLALYGIDQRQLPALTR